MMAVRWCLVIFVLLIPDRNQFLTNGSDGSTSTSSIQPSPVPPIPDTKSSSGSSNNDDSNWLLILLIVALFVATIAIAIHLSYVGWQNFMKRPDKRHSSEMQLLLNDTPQDIETVEKPQQPRIVEPEGRETPSGRISIPVKQQLPVAAERSSLEQPEELRSQGVGEGGGGGIPKGLANIGNTCYFNSVLQCLSQTHLLGEKLYAPAESGELTVSFKEFLNLVQFEKRQSFVPNYLFTVFCNAVPRFKNGGQQDGHECLRRFLDELRKEEKNHLKNSSSDGKDAKTLTLVEKLFGGHFITVYVCEMCNTPYHICEPFLDISLPLMASETSVTTSSGLNPGQGEGQEEDHGKSAVPETPYQVATRSILIPLGHAPDTKFLKPLPRNGLSIEDCLQYFIRKDSVTGGYLCSSCSIVDRSIISNSSSSSSDHVLRDATKQTMILNPPAILTIHLKRFEQKSHVFVKRENKVSFGELLDLAPFCSRWCMRNEKNETNLWYGLYAVVVHTGSLQLGHYIAYIKVRDGNRSLERFMQKKYFDKDMNAERLIEMMNEEKEKEEKTKTMKGPRQANIQTATWYCMNDSDVTRVSLENVLEQNAYLLFYERLDSAEA